MFDNFTYTKSYSSTTKLLLSKIIHFSSKVASLRHTKTLQEEPTSQLTYLVRPQPLSITFSLAIQPGPSIFQVHQEMCPSRSKFHSFYLGEWEYNVKEQKI